MIQATTLDFAVVVIYFLAILGFGSWFGRYTKTTRDFFFGGQRFAWWLIALSCVATVVGSYSFMKYSAVGFQYGLSSSMTYLNDWFFVPFFVLGWFPVIYFMRIKSVPEYFGRRFNEPVRLAAMLIILVYMIGYVGINFYTLGVALQPILQMDLYTIVIGVAIIAAIYMHAGGQTSVIMTDLLQAFVLLAAGFTLLYLGLDHVGGLDKAVDGLNTQQKLPFAQFNDPPKFNFVGIFWQDALASSFAFWIINQGLIMRFMSVRMPKDGVKAVFTVVLFLMPLAALAIANSGWIGRSMVTYGMIPADTEPQKIFMTVASMVTQPGIFGLIVAALTAALMSTIDTLIAAVSAIFVNDIWRPFVTKNDPKYKDAYYLKVARITAIASAVVGVLLVPIFAQDKSIYVAHGKFIATVTPPMVVTVLLAIFWKRFTSAAALATLLGGSLLVFTSAWNPWMIEPFAHGISPEGGFKFMRAFFGLGVSLVIAVVVSLLTRPKSNKEIEGLVIDSIDRAKVFFKGGKPNEKPGGKVLVEIKRMPKPTKQVGVDGDQDGVRLSARAMQQLAAEPGDLLYVSDARWWFGGLRSIHTVALKPHREGDQKILITTTDCKSGHFDNRRPLIVEKVI